ncbi:MAG: transcriptional repressor [Candidatus Nomurabacteria bacterium]|jgi:Fur family peroxide stress response transcriptional regulator|nr:transcriptional repressor [Candidatus Nomurabacteria bacterium]
MKYSRQRELVAEDVWCRCDHPTAAMVYDHVRKKSKDISLATVYRNLNQLVDEGKVEKLSMPDGADRYDGNIHEHQHVVCECCGAVLDVILGADFEEKLAAEILVKTGARVKSCRLMCVGTCERCACRKNKGKEAYATDE